jgi:hypothetical protein
VTENRHGASCTSLHVHASAVTVMPMTTTKTAASEYSEGVDHGAREALADAWTRETFAAWVAMCGPASSDFDRGFRAGVERALAELGQ